MITLVVIVLCYRLHAVLLLLCCAVICVVLCIDCVYCNTATGC